MGEMGDSSYNFRPTSSTCIWGVGSNPVVNIYILIFLLSHLQAVAALLCQTISMTSEKTWLHDQQGAIPLRKPTKLY
jgi:hypothetical protein